MSSQRVTVRPGRLLQRGLGQIAFWGAILVPLAYLPLLYRLDSTDSYLLLGGLILLNVCCLVVDQFGLLEQHQTGGDP
ncbi:hypothetical protein [Halovenus marina]|uniref:hypothetical protein n=1 Tax=Halovenus marina TaxID=3396621 RepID=UPI003F57033F